MCGADGLRKEADPQLLEFHAPGQVARDAEHQDTVDRVQTESVGLVAALPMTGRGGADVQELRCTRWANEVQLTTLRTLGGHRRYRESEVRRLSGGRVSSPEVEPRPPHGWR